MALATGMFSSAPDQPPAPPTATAATADAAQTTATPEATPAPQVAATPAPPAPPPLPRCGPVEAPERLGALPAGVTLSPADLVCIAKRWINVGRPGDAVLLLTRAIQESPSRVYGPASLELARLYDPGRDTPGWPSSAGYALEKYQDAINDPTFPDIQQQARADREKLGKAQ